MSDESIDSLDSIGIILNAFKTASNLVITLEEELISIREIAENNRNELDLYRARLRTLTENDKIDYEVFTPKTSKSRYQDEIETVSGNVEDLVETDRNLSSKIGKLEIQLKDLILIRDALKSSTLISNNSIEETGKTTFEFEMDNTLKSKIRDKAVFCLKIGDLDRERCQLELREIIKMCELQE